MSSRTLNTATRTITRTTATTTDAARFVAVAGRLANGLEPNPHTLLELTPDWRAHADVLLGLYKTGGAESVKRGIAALTLDHPEVVNLINTYKPRQSTTLQDLAAILPGIEWTWKGYVPRGCVTLVAGAPGSGKSALCLWLTKSTTTGAPWPNGEKNTTEPGKVVWCDTEATQALLLERAQMWGIPLDRIVIPTLDADRPLEDVLLDTPEGWEALEREITTHRPGLVIVDSLRGAHRGDEKDAQMQAIMSKLATLARDYNTAIVVVHHLRKLNPLERTDTVDPDRVRGSGVTVAMSRVVLAVDRPNGDDLEHQRISVIKNNLAKFAPALGFRIGDTGLTFGPAPEPPHKETAVDRAAEFLRARLRGAPIDSAPLIAEAEQAGITDTSLSRAREKLGITSVKVGKVWKWSLPAKE